MEKEAKTGDRRYPAVYEKAIPIALGIIVLTIVALLSIAFGILFGLF